MEVARAAVARAAAMEKTYPPPRTGRLRAGSCETPAVCPANTPSRIAKPTASRRTARIKVMPLSRRRHSLMCRTTAPRRRSWSCRRWRWRTTPTGRPKCRRATPRSSRAGWRRSRDCRR
eukprot:633346-Prymnesium_polylepis.1